MTDDYLDLDSVLFGPSDPPADGSFDPFLPGLGRDESESYGLDGATDDSDPTDGPDGVLRYGGFGGQGHREPKPDHDEPNPGEGRTDFTVVGADEQRAGEAARAGDRHLRRVATNRTGSVGEGEVGNDGTENVASSIAAAQQRIRAVASAPTTDDDERAIAGAALTFTGGSAKPQTKREYQKQHILGPPQFQECEMEATLMTVKSNVVGNWILQLSIPPTDKDAVFALSDAYGLALNVKVTRKRHGAG